MSNSDNLTTAEGVIERNEASIAALTKERDSLLADNVALREELQRVRREAVAEALAISCDIYLRTGSPAISVQEIEAAELHGKD